jgi:hypothetical protein
MQRMSRRAGAGGADRGGAQVRDRRGGLGPTRERERESERDRERDRDRERERERRERRERGGGGEMRSGVCSVSPACM